MTKENFIDYVKIFFRSGDGGNGSVHFRREKFIPKGGPDGGDGGRGGHIIIKGNKQLWTLLHLKYKKNIKAGNGKPGLASKKTGAQGKDVIIDVPVGTVIKDAKTDEIIFEIMKDGETKILLEGGKGGLGNINFKSPVNQTPRYAQPGEKGKGKWIILELKLLADLALVGFPNSGKSTLLSVLTAAKPKIANYPFTTLKPNLGVVSYHDFHSFVIADIPGIIEGAHKGKGLGTRFLKHVQRNPALLFLIPVTSKNIIKEYKILLNELKNFDKKLLDKKRILAISKSDLINKEKKKEILNNYKITGIPCVLISSVTGEGIKKLKDILWKEVFSSKVKKKSLL